MPVEHVVLLKAAPGSDPAGIAAIAPRWRELILAIPGVQSAHIGALVSPDPKGYTHMVHIRLASPEAVAAFGPHPNHLATMPLLEGKVSELLIADLYVD